MGLNPDKVSKLLFSGTLVLFLVPTFVIVLHREILFFSRTLQPASPTIQQAVSGNLPPSPASLTNEEITNLIEDTVKAEVQENFDFTLSLINLLLTALAIIPILSGFFLWTLRNQIEEKSTARSGILADEKIKELIEQRKAELETLKIEQTIKLINFSIKENVHPVIEERYRVMFQQAFLDGFPSQSFVTSIDRETRARLDEYIQIFRDFIKSYSEFLKADDYTWLGDACLILNQYLEAENFYTRASYLNPNSFRILHRVGNGKLALKDYKGAINYYTKAIDCTDENSPEFRSERHAWLYHNRGKAHYKIYEYEGAIQDYQNALKYNPDQYHSLYWQGNAFAGLGKFDQAINCYNEAYTILENLEAKHEIEKKEFRTDCEWILHSTGDAYRKIGDSCHQINRAGIVECDWLSHNCTPNDSCQERLNCYKQAINYYNQAEKINNRNIAVFHKRGKAYRELGEYEKAEDDYRKAINLAIETGKIEDSCNLLANMADVLRRLAQKAEQAKDFQTQEEREKESKDKFKTALDQCAARRLQSKLSNVDDLAQFYSNFDTARCYSLRGEVRRADKYMQDAFACCPSAKRKLAYQWAKSDSDFNNWYWYHQSQKQNFIDK